ncbi:MAG: hypothetical protein MZV63_53240 [Marinilabiliales bacterium]|nr:hypothetical protein [Marinilabiliales bacterium]
MARAPFELPGTAVSYNESSLYLQTAVSHCHMSAPYGYTCRRSQHGRHGMTATEPRPCCKTGCTTCHTNATTLTTMIAILDK